MFFSIPKMGFYLPHPTVIFLHRKEIVYKYFSLAAFFLEYNICRIYSFEEVWFQEVFFLGDLLPVDIFA